MGHSKFDEGDDVRWDDYRAFIAVAQTSSIRRAAADLRMTQSAFSKQLGSKLNKSVAG